MIFLPTTVLLSLRTWLTLYVLGIAHVYKWLPVAMTLEGVGRASEDSSYLLKQTQQQEVRVTF